MFRVYDNNTPADVKSYLRHDHKRTDIDFSCSRFATFKQAQAYAWKWLGPAEGGSDDGLTGVCLAINTPYDYSGYGDMIEIREVK